MHSSGGRLRRVLAAATAGIAILSTAELAGAATNSGIPSLANWGVWKTCGSQYPTTANCAQVRATAEDPTLGTAGVLYAVGDFTQAISNTGSSSSPYNDLVAIDETTGGVVTTFAAHSFNGRINAVAVDPATHRVFVGGAFTRVDGSGTHAQHAAAFDGATGALLNFNMRASSTVDALLLGSGSMLYVGGQFTSVGGTPRTALAAVDRTTGALVTTFTPPMISWSGSNKPDVRTLALGNDANGAPALYVGGHFDSAGGAAHMSVIRVDPVTGGLDPSFAPKIEATTYSTGPDPLQAADGIVWVDGSQDGTPGIVVAQAGHTNRGYRFDTSGNSLWKLTPDGDMQAVALSGGSVYFGGHFRCVATAPSSCYTTGGVTRVHIAAFDLTTGVVDPDFTPAMNPSNAPYFYGVWSLEVTANKSLWAGGVFTQVGSAGKAYKRPKLAVFPALAQS